MDDRADKKTSYQDAGVDIEKGSELIRRLKKTIDNTHRKGVIGGLGGFGGLFDLGSLKYKQPILVSGTDGVGTKIKLAIENNMHDTIGIDLVAMCVNDIIVQGAKPLFFLDYFACSKLDINIAETVINGIGVGCSLAECSLIGGETAEMPGMYNKNDYDLAGFCVGVVDKKNIINKNRIKKGNILVGFESSGFHSNGFSLINKLIENRSLSLTQKFKNTSLGKALIKPTKLYVDIFKLLRNKISINGAAHITGGGLTENLPRVIPDKYTVHIDESSLKIPDLFKLIQEKAILNKQEMLKTFNCGIGMVLIINKEDINTLEKIFNKTKYKPKIIGYIDNRNNKNNIVYE
jgi:phosphoribosylformylglycinamidine cyclo-ligase